MSTNNPYNYIRKSYKLRKYLFQKLQFLACIFAYNRTVRDSWVKGHLTSLPDGIKLLDVGCGSCPYRNLSARFQYVTHDFVQLSSEQLQGGEGYGKVDIVSDISNLPIDDNSFDVVLCTEVIEHVPEPIVAIREFARILKPGGLLLLSAPMRSGLHQKPYHYYGGFTPYWYQKFLIENNFCKISIQPVGNLYWSFLEEGQRVIQDAFLFLSKNPFLNLFKIIFAAILLPIVILIIPIFCLLFKDKGLMQDFRLGNLVSAYKKN